MSPADPEYVSSLYNDNDIHDVSFSKRGCCFWIPLSSNRGGSSSEHFWQRIRSAESMSSSSFSSSSSASASVTAEPWWFRGWKTTVRGWSALVSRRKWRALFRRFRRRQRRRANKYAKFQYDPMSYSRNFDEGPGQNGHFDEDMVGREFSSRYSLPPS
ncbi:hypothetical protein Tsubulata_035634, partial [Turnera subulata]